MKLPIEEWAENNISDNAIEIVREAVICYKAGAYRSAYLMFYLAFKLTIRDRIINGSKPDEISDDCWNNQIISDLTNDDKWESKLNNIMQATIDNPTKEIGKIFKFNNLNRIKNRYEYWKNIRNSCAHAKEEHITASTVEQFWNYMKDDLAEYYVLGGKKYLLDKLCWIHKYFYSSEEDYLRRILKDISSVYKSDVKECFNEFYKNEHRNVFNKESDNEFWKIIINLDDDNIINGLIDFLYDNVELFLELYIKFPKIFSIMIMRHKSFIQEQIAPILERGYYLEEDVFWSIIVDILATDYRLIDLNRITNDYKKFKMIDEIKLNSFQISILDKYGVFKKFLFNAGKEFFRNDADSNWRYYSYSSGMSDEYVRKCFEYIQWDIEIIEKINIAYKELEDNIKMRANNDSRLNGITRKNCYNTIINRYKDEIIKVIQDNNKSVSDYEYIDNVL